jgi:hypothetical protein
MIEHNNEPLTDENISPNSLQSIAGNKDAHQQLKPGQEQIAADPQTALTKSELFKRNQYQQRTNSRQHQQNVHDLVADGNFERENCLKYAQPHEDNAGIMRRLREN